MKQADVGIIGGGLAGLSLSILLARKGYSVVLFEKNVYPFHRVCGEYISLESYNFLERFGLPLDVWNLPIIKKLQVSSPKGTVLHQNLPLGGFGISRFRLDFELAQLARQAGVQVLENSTVTQVDFQENIFTLRANETDWTFPVCIGTFGKRSNLDIQWQRPFVQQKANKLNNYVGVKYHIEVDFPKDTIALHNFRNGYCGMSAIEDNRYCLCYLSTAQNLKEAGSIKQMEASILSDNPHLKHIFETAQFLFDKPVSISQISFEAKNTVENQVLMAGDSAGMITPLCGNGMSMALHAAKILADLIPILMANPSQRTAVEQQYTQLWKKQFATRLWFGRKIQARFGNPWQTELFLQILRPFPYLVQKLVRATHGEAF